MIRKLSSFFDARSGARKLARYTAEGQKVEALAEEIGRLSPEALSARVGGLAERVRAGEALESVMTESFALTREAATRTLGQRHFPVQLVGGAILADRGIAEMRTGEGKTLVATLPTALFALAGKGVHLVTVNDYLARRDAAWMGQVYAALGLSLGVVTTEGSYIYDAAHTAAASDESRDEAGSFRVFHEFLRPATKREAYAADITYGTNNEFGFDYLRDNTVVEQGRKVQRGHAFAIVDEVDSILIDESRTPLIISAPVADAEGLYQRFAEIVEPFAEGEDYVIDHKRRAVEITGAGITKAEAALGVENLYADGVKYAHHLHTAVRAMALYHKDEQYVVRDGEIVIVDDFTGRLQPGRRWSEGLHQAIEAREGVRVREESRTLASVTFQNYFRLYDRLAGMTGTALSSREELYTVYGLEVVPVPTNRAVARDDRKDLIFRTRAGKYRAVARRVEELHKKGQPVLVGTVSIDDNQVVSEYLTAAGVPHEVLNAKNHEREGEIIAQAGRVGRVTVATNMAGRGVDIKLGGNPATDEDRAQVHAAGGLAVIGTERHEARRIDDQLRGRAGRQGDPGQTQFFVSAEDRLLKVFGGSQIEGLMSRLGVPEDEAIESGLLTTALEQAQKRIEGFHFDARKQVLAYDDVLNQQRTAFYARRDEILGEDVAALHDRLAAILGEEIPALRSGSEEELALKARFVRSNILQAYDALWVEHLETMEYLRRSVDLRAMGQRDPLVEYRREGIRLFKDMEDRLASELKVLAERSKTIVITKTPPQETPIAPVPQDAGATGRNDLVRVRKGSEVRELKRKKAELLLREGWELLS